jgi:hypothetical protein
MNEEEKTVSELAKEIGVTKKVLQNKIYRENKKRIDELGHMVVSDGVPTRYFSIKEQNFIKSLYIEKIEMATEVLPKKDSNKTISINKVEDYLETILKEVSDLKEIVKRQSEEIADLKNNDILKIESQEVKRSFWERFRGNKK